MSPIYEFKCSNCHRIFEELVLLKKDDDIGIIKCQTCGAYARKIISKSSFRLYGEGWTAPHNRGEYGKNNEPSERKTKTVKKIKGKGIK